MRQTGSSLFHKCEHKRSIFTAVVKQKIIMGQSLLFYKFVGRRTTTRNNKGYRGLRQPLLLYYQNVYLIRQRLQGYYDAPYIF